MRKRILLSGIIFCIGIFLSGCWKATSNDGVELMVLSEEDVSAFGKELIQGIDAAVSEYTDVNVLKRFSSSKNKSQNGKYLDQARQLKVKGLIVTSSIFNTHKEKITKMKQEGMTVAILEGDPNEEEFLTIGSDEEQWEAMFQKLMGGRTNRSNRIVLLSSESPTDYSLIREKRMSASIKYALHTKNQIDILRLGPKREENALLFNQFLKENQDVDFVVGITENNAEVAAEWVDQSLLSPLPKVIGLDATPEMLKKLETGKIHTIMRENPYEIGYTAVQATVKGIRNQTTAKAFTVEVIEINKENIFNQRIQRYLFPLSK